MDNRYSVCTERTQRRHQRPTVWRLPVECQRSIVISDGRREQVIAQRLELPVAYPDAFVDAVMGMFPAGRRVHQIVHRYARTLSAADDPGTIRIALQRCSVYHGRRYESRRMMGSDSLWWFPTKFSLSRQVECHMHCQSLQPVRLDGGRQSIAQTQWELNPFACAGASAAIPIRPLASHGRTRIIVIPDWQTSSRSAGRPRP